MIGYISPAPSSEEFIQTKELSLNVRSKLPPNKRSRKR